MTDDEAVDAKQQLIDELLSDGWEPSGAFDSETMDGIEDPEFEEFAWGIVPCPNCGHGMLIGIYDPDDNYDSRRVPMTTLVPPDHHTEDDADDDPEGFGGSNPGP